MRLKWVWNAEPSFVSWINHELGEGGFVMSERQRMLRRVQIYEFALDDARLYLDSIHVTVLHLTIMKKHQDLREKGIPRICPAFWSADGKRQCIY